MDDTGTPSGKAAAPGKTAPGKPTASPQRDARAARLAAQLKANLKRRKAQAKARDPAGPGEA